MWNNKSMDCSSFQGFRFWLNDSQDNLAVRGWVHDVEGKQFTMIANSGERFVASDEVACVITNFGHEIRFIGRVEKQAFGVLLVSAVKKIRASDAKEAARLKVNQKQTLEHEGIPYEVRVNDVSPGGLGIESTFPLNPGEVSEMVFSAPCSEHLLRLEVRSVHCTEIAPGIFRTGLEIISAGRLDDAKWRAFLQGGDRLVAPKARHKTGFERRARRKKRAA
jgi:hypothetical protein